MSLGTVKEVWQLPEGPVRIMFNIVRVFGNFLSSTKHDTVVIVRVSHAEPRQLK